jgi:uroporphyrinogen decarboxylase
MMYRDAGLYDALLSKLADTVAVYLAAQVAAGAQAVQVFDTWGGTLAPDDYAAYDLPYTVRVIERCKGLGVPVILYVGDGSSLLEATASTDADVIGLDWRINIGTARKRLGMGRSVQGNLDPVSLMADPETIRRKAAAVIDAAGTRGHVFNLGHGILPPTPPENARALVDFVHEYSAARIAGR